MKSFKICAFYTLIALASGFAEEPTQEPPASDQDLFRKNERAITLNGEFLYWTVFTSANTYALKKKCQDYDQIFGNFQSSNGPNGVYQTAEYDWDPGLRVSASFYNAPKFWEVTGEYLWFQSRGSDKVRPPCDLATGLTPTLISPFGGQNEYVVCAESDLRLEHQLGNFMVTRVFHIENNPHLRMKLSGGLSGTYFEQDWHVKYRFNQDFTNRLKNDWRYWGVGMRLGLAFDWYWFENIYLTGKWSNALFVGEFKNRGLGRTDKPDGQAGQDNSFPFTNFEYKNYRPSYHVQFAVGPSYQKSFTKSRMEVFAGYELNLWLNLNEINQSPLARNPNSTRQRNVNDSPLLLNGLTVRMSWDF